MSSNPRILVVDDNATNRMILEEILEDQAFDVDFAEDGPTGLELAEAELPDLVLLDIMLPGMDGYEVCRRMRANERLSHTKIVMLSAKAMTAERLAGYEAGADDYLTKPFEEEELLSKVRVFLRLKTVEEAAQAHRELIRQLERANRQLAEEIVRREEAEERIRHDSLHDVLTRLPNRALLMDRLERCRLRQAREPEFDYAVFFLDLDEFKLVNDSLGHEAGDQLLVEVSNRLAHSLRELDSVSHWNDSTTARLGGDEFVLLVEGLHPEDANSVERRLRKALARPVRIGDHELFPNGSIGVAFGRPEYETAGDVLRDADTAMYHAKASGKCCTAFFDDSMREKVVMRQRLEEDLLLAIEYDQLELHYQPIVSLATGGLHGLEALVRWQHPERGLLMPKDFIPLAEQCGLILPLGRWVMYSACREMADWRKRYPGRANLCISINVSGRQIVSSNIADTLQETLGEFDLDPRHVNLELTETVLFDAQRSRDLLQRLRADDVGLHMDDFGTGYSSLKSMTRLPISALKLDGSFVAEMLKTEADATTVRAVLEMAHARGLKVIAEGVELIEQADALRDLGCDFAQGYFFSYPLPREAAERLISGKGGESNAA